MTLATLLSRTPQGLEAPLVRVEVDVGAGLPTFSVVGLLETAVRESKDRVRAAIANGGFEFPAGRVTVNLAPADLPKEGGRFDLAIAIGILVASGQLPAQAVRRASSCTANSRSAVTCTARAACCRARCGPRAPGTSSSCRWKTAPRPCWHAACGYGSRHTCARCVVTRWGRRHWRSNGRRHHRHPLPRCRAVACLTWRTCADRPAPAVHWRSPPQADTTFC